MTTAEKITRAKADYDEVYEAGKKSEYDGFWDRFQNYGRLNSYFSKFSNSQSANTWTDATYNPKYEIDCTSSKHQGASGVFQYTTQITDLKVPMNCRGSKMVSTFNYCYVVRIPLLRVDENTTFTNTFNLAEKLEELTIEGTIGQKGLNFQWSARLSKASITSVINALSTTTSGLSVTFSKTAVETAFGSTTSAEWTTLIGTRSNWTISLV